jgi:lysophospholipase L1-like esterase
MARTVSIRRLDAWLAVPLCVAIQACSWVALARFRSDTLDRNPAWQIMKQEVIYHPSAFEDFLHTPIREGVNLWLGQGFEGIRWKKPGGFSVTRIRARIRLDFPGSYAYVLFREGPQGSYGLLLSRDPAHASGFYAFSPEWEALAFQAVLFSGDAVDHEILIDLNGSNFQARLDARPLAEWADSRFAEGTAGFKGGFYPVHVLSAEFTDNTGGAPVTWRDDFHHPSFPGWLSMGCVIAVGMVLAMAARLPTTDRSSRLRLGFACAASVAFSILQVVFQSVWAGVAGLILWFGAASRSATVPLNFRAGGVAGVIAAVIITTAATRLAPGTLPVHAAQGSRVHASLADPSITLADPVRLSTSSVSAQTVSARVRLRPNSLLEIRFWSVEPAFDCAYACSFQAHALVLSTTPAVEGGFYRYDAGVMRLAGASVQEDRWIDLRLVTDSHELSAYDGSVLLARARTEAAGSGFTSLHLFAGSADIAYAALDGVSESYSGARWSLPPGTGWAAVIFAGTALLLAVGMRPRRFSAGLQSLPQLGSAACFIGLAAMLTPFSLITQSEARVLLWAGFACQIVAGLRLLAPRFNGTMWFGIATVAVLSLTLVLVNGWFGPFRVVQLEMEAAVPPIPFDGLWYRHPSFRACNQYLWTQEFAGRKASPARNPALRRVVCIGASQTLGFGASDFAHAYPAQLERTLNAAGPAYEVLNAGVPGSFTLTSRAYFEGLLSRFHPDIVVIDFCAADYLYSALLRLEQIDPDARIHQIELRGFSEDPFTRLLAGARAWRGYRQFQAQGPGNVAAIQADYQRHLAQLVQSVRGAGAIPIVMLEPKTQEISNPIIDYNVLYQTVKRVALSISTPVVDPGPVLLEADRSGVVWWDYAHMTDYGYRRMAMEVAPTIRKLERYGNRPPIPAPGLQ